MIYVGEKQQQTTYNIYQLQKDVVMTHLLHI